MGVGAVTLYSRPLFCLVSAPRVCDGLNGMGWGGGASDVVECVVGWGGVGGRRVGWDGGWGG